MVNTIERGDILLSFFGFIITAGMLGCGIVLKGQKEQKRKENAIRDGLDYYFDCNGKRRQTKTDRIVIETFIGGHKLIDSKTMNVIKDYDAIERKEWINETNKKLVDNDSPVFWKECPKYFNAKTKSYKNTHLYERSSGRPYKIVMPVAIDKVGESYVQDKTRFTIVYLDENNGMAPLEETNTVPKELYYRYLFGN